MEVLIFILLSLFCFIISSAVHELGHILSGLMQRFKFHWLVVGPFGIKRDENDNIVFYFEKDVSLWGGLGAVVPTDDNVDNYKKFGRILLGGPMASIIFGVICLPIGLIENNTFLILLGVMPLSMGIVTLIPLRNGAFYTDGGRWLRMHKNEETKAVEVAIWNLTQKAIIQGNYANVNFDEIKILINDEEIRTKYLGHYYAYWFYKDNENRLKSDQEKAELERMKGKVPKQMVSMFRIDN